MKKKTSTSINAILIFILFVTFFYGCNDNNNDITDDIIDDTTTQSITEADKAALLFMLEEEKLARDTYSYLNNLWSINQFANIKNSEQTHMNAIENLLIQYNIEYTILNDGEFVNQDLQNFYDQFVIEGALSQAKAQQIGATIEDLDIVDLETNINNTTNTEIQFVFESLQCGSRNHLRSFVKGIENGGNTYTPQFLTQIEYNIIISSSNEKCN